MRIIYLILIVLLIALAVFVYRQLKFRLPAIIFCSRQQGQQLFSSQSVLELVSKYKFNECRARSAGRVADILTYRNDMQRCYCDAVLEFTEEDKIALTQVIQKFPELARRSWKFLKLADHLDWGYPFTLNNTIVLPSKQIKNITPETLMHESIHIEQRMNPAYFTTFYEQEWKYRRARQLKIPASVAMNTVTNPDGPDDTWVRLIGKTWYWFALVLQEEGTNPIGMAYRCEQTSPNAFEVTDSSMPCRTLKDSFNGETNIYHPNEFYASLNSKMSVLSGN